MNRWKKNQYADMGSQGGFCDLEDGNPYTLAAKEKFWKNNGYKQHLEMTNSLLLTIAIEIVDLPTQNGDFT